MTTPSLTHHTELPHWLTTFTQRLAFLAPAGMFTLFALGLAYLQYATPAIVETDGYYHIKMAWLMRQEGLTPAFGWLPLTILNESAYYDHHFLYHVYLMLFAWVDPAVDGGAGLTAGAKLASVVLPALAFTTFWGLLHQQKLPYSLLWALALFAISAPFLYRMSMPRAQSASLLVLLLAIYLMWQEKYRWLLPLGFFYVWLYNAFPLLLLVAGVHFISLAMREQKLVWSALFYPAVGLALGVVINPYFPANVTFTLHHLLPKIGESSVAVGNEWRPYDTWILMENSGYALAMVLVGTLALGWQEKRLNSQTLMALGLTIVFGFMLFKSRRFVEYFPPFALLFCALSCAPVLAKWRIYYPRLAFVWPVALFWLWVIPFAHIMSQAYEQIGNSQPADKYAAASLWLAAEAPAGSQIFQTDWDDFTRLFFYNTQMNYTVGLDPTYLQIADPALYEEWVDITRGRVEQPGRVIAEKFGGQYVFSDLNHGSFMNQAEDDPHLQELYRDEYAVIYQVLP